MEKKGPQLEIRKLQKEKSHCCVVEQAVENGGFFNLALVNIHTLISLVI